MWCHCVIVTILLSNLHILRAYKAIVIRGFISHIIFERVIILLLNFSGVAITGLITHIYIVKVFSGFCNSKCEENELIYLMKIMVQKAIAAV